MGCKLEVARLRAHERAREHKLIGDDDLYLYLYLCLCRELVGHRRLLDGNDLVGRTRLVADFAENRAWDTGNHYREAR